MKEKKKIYIYPTDTVWGIGANICCRKFFFELSKIKKTSRNKPLSILFTTRKELEDYLFFPMSIDQNKIFSLADKEVTFLFPVEFAKNKFPGYLKKLSPFISVRLISSHELLILREKIGAPFFTTSLNITTNPPITYREDALSFQEKYCPYSFFIDSNRDESLSGVSSTIVQISIDGKALIVRAGKNIDRIKNQLVELNLL